MMLNDPLFIVAAIASLVVLVILMIGIGGFAKGGEFNRKHSNRTRSQTTRTQQLPRATRS